MNRRLLPDSPFVVRVAGLPVSALDDLRCTATETQLDDAAELSHWLRAEARGLSDALYPVIGQLTEPPLRPRLVALRRTVFQGRSPDRLLDDVAGALPADLVARIRHWAGERTRRDRLVKRLPAILAEEIAGRLPVVRELAAQPDLRRGLVISSPSLYASLSSWLATGASRLPSRRVLSSLVRYVGRMTMKTSPLSTFTLSGLGHWAEIGTPVRQHAVTRRHTVVQPQVSMATMITGMLTRRPELAGRLHVRLNPSVVDDGGMLRFLTCPPDCSVIAIRATDAVRRCLAVVRAHDEDTVAGLRGRLAAEPDGAVLAGLADRLVELGLIERYVPVPDQAPDLFGELVAWLEQAALPAPDTEAVRTLASLHGLARRYAATDDPGSRLELLGTFQSDVRTLAAKAGVTAPVGVRGALHENVHVADPVATCDPRCWQPVFDDLRAVVRLASVFDTSLPLRLALAHYVNARGKVREIPFLSLYHALHKQADDPLAGEVLRRNQGFDDPAGTVVDRVRELRELRQRVVDLFGERTHIEPGEVFDHAAAWPSYVRQPGSVAVYGQLVASAGEDPALVVNSVGSGHGRGRSRVLALLGKAAPEPLAKPGRSGVVFAEFDHLFDLNINTRVSELAFGIDLPGHVSHRPARQRIPLGELVVVRDRVTGLLQLRWPRGGVEVRPVQTGMMADPLLPAPVRLLIRAFGETGYLLHSRGTLLGRPLPRVGTDDVVTTPRLEIGRVVARRASWTARRSALPELRRGEDDSHRMLRMLEWLRLHGIPRRCFVRTVPTGKADTAVFSVDRKPMYVDFANWFLLVAFERILDVSDQVVVFSEVLPAPVNGSARVTEFLFTLSDFPEQGNVVS